ncbi:MAG: O-succinylhomoserine sulfhydrylase [Pseudomonadota bacterium]
MPKDSMTKRPLSPRTRMVHAGGARSEHGEMSEALYLTQGFAYPSAEAAEARFNGEDDGFIYARYGNPTVRMFEERIAALEGAEDAFATASGMAAVNAALMSQLKAGDHVVAARALFGSCLYIVENLLPRFGLETTLVDGADHDAWRAAMRPETKAVFLETPSNPTLEIYDLAAISEIAHGVGANVIVDNVFATPMFQRPLELGADIVIYSATKHIDGQGRCLGGVVLGTQKFIRETLEPYLKHTGGAMSPFNAWVMVKGLETLDVRVHSQAASAARIADALAESDAVRRVIYPGRADHPQRDLAARQMETGGTMIAFDLGDQETAFRFLNALEIFLISNNLGDAKSIATHPATTTHQRLSETQRDGLGIGPGLIRLSVGLEDPDDLIADLLDALAA